MDTLKYILIFNMDILLFIYIMFVHMQNVHRMNLYHSAPLEGRNQSVDSGVSLDIYMDLGFALWSLNCKTILSHATDPFHTLKNK